MADFNFAPLQMQLFGGQGTAWEPLGQEGNLKPYQQQMGYDLYSKVFSDFNADRFRTSITSDPARMQQAEQLFQQIDSMQFKSMSPFDNMQRGWQSGGAWAQGAGYDFNQPQLGAGSMNPALSGNPNVVAQREAAYQGGGFGGGFGASAFGGAPVSAPNWGGASPFASVGGSRVDVSQFSPEAQQQIWNAMGMSSGSVGGSASDPVETVSRMAKVIKEELGPAAEGVTKQISTLSGAMRGDGGMGGFGGGGAGFSGDSGFGGGGGSSGGGGGGWGDWFSGMGQRVGGALTNIGGRFGDMLEGIDIRPPPLFRMRQANSIFINPMMQDMNKYMTQTATQDLGMLQSGEISYGDLMAGQYGDIKRRQIAGEEWTYNLGKQVYSAYGGIANATMGGDAANGILGAAMGIGAPAVGMGMIGGAIGGMVGLGGPAGLLVGGATALVGAGGYAINASQNMMAIGQQQVSTEGQRRSGQYNLNGLFNNFEGVVGDYAEWWRDQLGTTSPTESQRYRNAGNMFDLTQQYSQGGIGRNEFADKLGGLGYSLGEGLTGAQGLFYQNAGKQGMDRNQAGQFLSYWQRYNPGTMPSGQQATDWQALTLAGVDLPTTVGSYAASLGISPANQGGMDLANGDISRYLLGLPAGSNQQLASEGITATAQDFTSANAARRRAGLSTYNALNYQTDLYKQNPGLVDATAAYGAVSGNLALTSPSFYTNVVQPTAEERGYGQAGAQFDTKKYFQTQGGWASSVDLYNQGIDYGNNSPALAAAIQGYADLDPDQQRLAARIAGGDRWALSQQAGAMGDERLNTINTKTGMPIRYSGPMSTAQYSMMQTDQPDLFRLTFDQAQGGEKQWEQNILNSQRGLDLYQYNQATAGRNIAQLLQTGGAAGVNAQGFALGGDGLAGLAQLFQSQGMGLQTGNGMGLWQVQDAQTMLSRQQQQYGYDRQGQSLVLGNQQYNESFELNQRQFNLSTGYQRNEMNIGRSQQQAQEGWQAEDLGLSRNKMELNFGWQMEDYDRNIRFARGRDRQNLMREQERATIMHGLDETGQNNQEERFKTEQQWNKEEFDRKKSYFEQSKSLQQEEMNLNKKHHDEMQALNQQAHDKEKQWMQQEWQLQDQQRLLSRQNDEMQYKMQSDMAIAVEKVRQNIIPYQDALKASGLEYQEQEGHIKMLTMDMSVLAQWLDVVHGKVGALTGTSGANGIGNITPSTHVGGYGDIAAGGSVSSGSGVSHLAEMVGLLRQIVSMGPGRLNATIYTNDNQVKTSSLFQRSLSTVRN